MTEGFQKYFCYMRLIDISEYTVFTLIVIMLCCQLIVIGYTIFALIIVNIEHAVQPRKLF